VTVPDTSASSSVELATDPVSVTVKAPGLTGRRKLTVSGPGVSLVVLDATASVSVASWARNSSAARVTVKSKLRVLPNADVVPPISLPESTVTPTPIADPGRNRSRNTTTAEIVRVIGSRDDLRSADLTIHHSTSKFDSHTYS
jgi:hypothetical protein